MNRYRNWCFTLNNPTLSGPELLKELDDDVQVRYCVFQEEKGQDETPHYQGYVELNRAIPLATMKLMIPRAHFERRRGNRDQARDYCMKEDTRQDGPWECGDYKAGGQGARTDLLEAIATADETYSIAEVARQHPLQFVKYSRGLSQYIFHTRPARSIANPPSVHLYYGTTGSGKTRKAFEDNESIYRKAPDSTWFDGYYGQDCLLLDDFSGRASKMPLSFLLILLDRYPVDVQIKGGHAAMTAQHIVITTNLHPVTWYDYANRQEQYRALMRRITSIYVFKGKLGSIQVTHKAFFDEWFDGCDEDTLFFTHADAEATMLISDDEEELSEDLALMEDDDPSAQPSLSDDYWDISHVVPNTPDSGSDTEFV